MADTEFDIVIRGGKVVDGTGEVAQTADVAIKADRIVAIGGVTGQGGRGSPVRRDSRVCWLGARAGARATGNQARRRKISTRPRKEEAGG